MSAVRRMASRILQFVMRQSPAETRSWGSAMLREMDFVESDWAALFWALGSTTAIVRHSLIQRLRDWRDRAGRARITAVLSGMVVAALVWTISVLALSSLMRASWIAPTQNQLAERLFVVVIPEAVYLLVAVALWRPQRRVAWGILAAGAILFTHAVVHVVTYG
jgi:hypothetical protein